MSRTALVRRLLASIGVAAALGLAACDSGDDDSGDTGSAGSSSAGSSTTTTTSTSNAGSLY